MKLSIRILAVLVTLSLLSINFSQYFWIAYAEENTVVEESVTEILNTSTDTLYGVKENNITWNTDTLLGTANYYDLFAFGNVEQLTHVEGSVAINGDYTGSNGLSMGTSIKHLTTDDTITLLINGQLNAQNYIMSCEAGKIGYNNLYTPLMPEYLFEKSIALNSEITTDFFKKAHEHLTDSNKYLYTLTTNSEYTIDENNNIVFECASDSDVAVFNLDYDNDERLIQNGLPVVFNTISINGLQKNVIINIKSSNEIKLNNFQNSEQDSNKILLNIIDTPVIDISNSNTHACVLAPNTDIKATNGYLSGNLVCNNLYSQGSFEIHLNHFDTTIKIPSVSDSDVTTPTTSSTSTNSTTISTTNTSVTSNSDISTTSSTSNTSSTSSTSNTSSSTNTSSTSNSTNTSSTSNTSSSTSTSNTSSSTSTSNTSSTSTTTSTSNTSSSTNTSNTSSTSTTTSTSNTSSTSSSTNTSNTSSTSTTTSTSNTSSTSSSTNTSNTSSTSTTTSKISTNSTTSKTTTTTTSYIITTPSTSKTITTTSNTTNKTNVIINTTKTTNKNSVLGDLDNGKGPSVDVNVSVMGDKVPDTSDETSYKGVITAVIIFIVSLCVFCCSSRKIKHIH